MFRKPTKKYLQCRGFTLLEILVVITIFGILMAFVIANLQTSKSKSRDQRRVSNIQELQLALETHFERYHFYPATLTALAPDFIAEVPKPPSGTGQNDYAYAGTGSVLNFCSGYHLGAVLENDIPPLGEDEDSVPRCTRCVDSTITCPTSTDFHGETESPACSGLSEDPEHDDLCYDVIEQ